MYVLYLEYWNLEWRNVIRCISEIINSIEFFITQMWKYHQFRELWLRIWFSIGFKNLKNQTILDKLLFCSDSLHIYKRFQVWLIRYYALRLTKLILGIKWNLTYAKSVRQNFTNLLRVVSLKTQSSTTISICNLGLSDFTNAPSTVLWIVLHSSRRSCVTKRKIRRSPPRMSSSLSSLTSNHYNLYFIVIEDA